MTQRWWSLLLLLALLPVGAHGENIARIDRLPRGWGNYERVLDDPANWEALLRSATDSCDPYYQAFQFVVWAGKSASDALAQVMFETVGEA